MIYKGDNSSPHTPATAAPAPPLQCQKHNKINKMNPNLVELHYRVVCGCDCRVTDLCHAASGPCVTDAPATGSASLPASRPLIPPNGGCHLAANLNAQTAELPHLAKLIPVRRASFPTARRLLLGAPGPGGPRHPPARQQHLSIISP